MPLKELTLDKARKMARQREAIRKQHEIMQESSDRVQLFEFEKDQDGVYTAYMQATITVLSPYSLKTILLFQVCCCHCELLQQVA